VGLVVAGAGLLVMGGLGALTQALSVGGARVLALFVVCLGLSGQFLIRRAARQ
jgi:hypothetical protein